LIQHAVGCPPHEALLINGWAFFFILVLQIHSDVDEHIVQLNPLICHVFCNKYYQSYQIPLDCRIEVTNHPFLSANQTYPYGLSIVYPLYQ